MSFDDYANHIYQKHRLAVALAIIKSKPFNIDTDKYLHELKSKVEDKMDDDDVTICSDDFQIDDDDDMNDSVTILKDFELNARVFKDFGDDKIGGQKPVQLPENLSQTTFYDGSQTQLPPNITESDQNTTYFEENHNSNTIFDKEQSLPENVVSKNVEFVTKMTNADQLANINKNNEQEFDERDSYNELISSNNKICNDVDATYYDSQKTVLYSIHGFTETYTHYSPSQNNIIIPNKYIYGSNKNQEHSTVQSMSINKEHISIANEDLSKAREVNSKSKSPTNISKNNTDTEIIGTEDNLDNQMRDNLLNKEVSGYSQTMRMFSQSDDDNFDKIHINNSDRTTNEMVNAQNLTQYLQNIDEYFDEIQNIETNQPLNINSNKNRQNFQITEMEITEKPSENKQNIDCNIENEFKKLDADTNTSMPNRKPKEIVTNSDNEYQLTKISERNKVSTELEIIEEECESQEIISYKILEEFNKVKNFLNRQNRRMSCDGYSTDSGYRSDSQIRSSNRSALQLSGNWLNQSGCCLFNYLMQCPLVAGTRDITNEIAQVLGQLVNRLHEEEKYPSFLEEMLETIDLLLRQVYEGESSGDNEFLKKDKNIQRILLLNKSIHIQKHSIEKISKILEEFHLRVTETDSTYELLNIDKVENISYLFHILEILLKKYLKNRDVLSQADTQNSQEDEKIFKKSSITDIWRKKWNPEHKVFEGSREKKCVLKQCSEVLNKIVVDCVSSYSLVAYSALKCFNSMQT